jgi:hypothetical protein
MKDEPEQKPPAPRDDRQLVWGGRAFGFSFLVILCTSAILVSQGAAQEDAPLTNRPKDLDATNFFNARGNGVKAAWNVDRNTIPENGELTATLIIKGADNPHRIVRPDLTKLHDFQTRFTITDKKDPPAVKGMTEVKFSYQLRPRNRSVEKVPSLDFYYYNPAAPAGKNQFQKTIAARVPITVTEAQNMELPAIPLHEPEQLFAVATGPQLLEKRQLITGIWPWVIVGLAGPLCALLWFFAWQRVFPDAGRLATMRRSRAARRAIDAVHRASRANDPPAVIAAAVLGYLRTRFPLPPGAATPSEIAAALAELHVADLECIAVAEFFRSCDAARFAPREDNGGSLAAAAESLIVRLEAA